MYLLLKLPAQCMLQIVSIATQLTHVCTFSWGTFFVLEPPNTTSAGDFLMCWHVDIAIYDGKDRWEELMPGGRAAAEGSEWALLPYLCDGNWAHSFGQQDSALNWAEHNLIAVVCCVLGKHPILCTTPPGVLLPHWHCLFHLRSSWVLIYLITEEVNVTVQITPYKARYSMKAIPNNVCEVRGKVSFLNMLFEGDINDVILFFLFFLWRVKAGSEGWGMPLWLGRAWSMSWDC